MKVLRHYKLVLLVFLVLLPMIKSQTKIDGSNCTIKNFTLYAAYNQTNLFIPIESKNIIINDKEYYPVNITYNYSISIPSLFNCSSNYTGTELFVGN
jgi:hypothetical protein